MARSSVGIELVSVIAIVALLALLLGATRGGKGGGGGGGLSADGGGLSPIRRRVGEILSAWLPAAWPDAKFRRIVGSSFDPATSPGTTCGALPGAVGVELGAADGITRWGVSGVIDVAKAHNAWRTPEQGVRPKLGDVLVLAFPPGSLDGQGIAHVGFAVHASGSQWTTADAGQGPRTAPRAEYVPRLYDPVARTLRRADSPATSERVLVGWLDLDAYAASVGGWPFPRKLSFVDWSRRDLPFYPCDPAECGER